MRKVQQNVLRTRTGMFRYAQFGSDTVDSQRCTETTILERYYKMFKVFEGFGALFSLSGVVFVMIFWGVTEFNVNNVPYDGHMMKTNWISDFQENPSDGWAKQAWKDKFWRDRAKAKIWMVGAEYLVQGDTEEAKKQNADKLLNVYDNYSKYPATVWLYDVASVRQPQQLPKALQTEYDSVSLVCPESSFTTCNPTQKQTYLKVQRHESVQVYSWFKSILHQQCSDKFGLNLHFTERWDDQTFDILDIPMNSYKLNMWGLLIVIYLVSFLFQAWRVYEYGKEFRPLGPDGLKWIEYGITSPLMLIVIAVSAGLRSVSLLVVLTFLQLALIMMGYVLEVLQQDYSSWVKYRFLAEKTSFSKQPLLKMDLNTVTEDEESSNETENNKTLVLDDFLDVISRNGCGEGKFNLLGSIGKQSSKQRFVIDFFYFLSFTLNAVIWTVVLTQLIRLSYTQTECGMSTVKMPFIVWFIVTSQLLGFLSFGAVSALVWFGLRGAAKNLLDSDDNQKKSLEDYKTACFNTWARGSFMYCLLNIAVKTSLEVSIFFFVSMYNANQTIIPDFTNFLQAVQ